MGRRIKPVEAVTFSDELVELPRFVAVRHALPVVMVGKAEQSRVRVANNNKTAVGFPVVRDAGCPMVCPIINVNANDPTRTGQAREGTVNRKCRGSRGGRHYPFLFFVNYHF